MPDVRHAARTTIGLLVLAIALSACSSAPSSPPPSPDPSVNAPIASTDPLPDDGAKVVVPRPGQLDVHPVAAETLRATVTGRSVEVAVDWWTRVEPCTILDTIVVERGEGTFSITLHEGRGPGDMACIAIAELHRAFIDLGELEPGTWTIRDATGGAPDIEVVVG